MYLYKQTLAFNPFTSSFISVIGNLLVLETLLSGRPLVVVVVAVVLLTLEAVLLTEAILVGLDEGGLGDVGR